MGDTKKIELIARGLIQQGRWVLVCRNIKEGYAYLPGGHIEAGETSGAALERELMEETGLLMKAGECLLVCEQMFTQNGKPRHEINLVFHVEPPHNPPHCSDDANMAPASDSDAPRVVQSQEGHIEFEWVEQAALGDLDLRPEVIRAWLVSGGDLGDTNRPGWLSSRE